MSKFRQLVEGVLEKTLQEAKILKIKPIVINDITLKKYPNYFPVYKNPTKGEINNLLANSIEKQIRGLVINDNVYVWDAYLGTHYEILNDLADEYNISSDDYIADFIYSSNKELEAGWMQLKDNYYIEDLDLTKNLLLNNKICLELFGKDKIENIHPHEEWEFNF